MNYDLSKEFAAKLGVMLDASLINYKHYELWCDEIIENMDKPPYWIIELTLIKYLPDALYTVNCYALSEPFVDFSYLELHDFQIACKYIKYVKKHISWAEFLLSAGDYSDAYRGCRMDCGDFYSMHNQFEDSEYSKKVERTQSKEIANIFSKHIKEGEKYYEYFMKYFRQYVLKKK
ncbi:MAG: hypothetical protein FWE85_00350 [Clostridiales bacterium]|nr:hypothetical protein [Clostridiales bacterium]